MGNPFRHQQASEKAAEQAKRYLAERGIPLLSETDRAKMLVNAAQEAVATKGTDRDVAKAYANAIIRQVAPTVHKHLV
jgi:hypothetical protein